MKPRFQLLFNVIMFLIVSDDCFGGDHYALPVEDLEMVHFFHSSKPIQIHKAIHDTVAVAKSIISLSLQSQFCIQVTRKIHKAMGRTIYQEKRYDLHQRNFSRGTKMHKLLPKLGQGREQGFILTVLVLS